MVRKLWSATVNLLPSQPQVSAWTWRVSPVGDGSTTRTRWEASWAASTSITSRSTPAPHSEPHPVPVTSAGQASRQRPNSTGVWCAAELILHTPASDACVTSGPESLTLVRRFSKEWWKKRQRADSKHSISILYTLAENFKAVWPQANSRNWV